MNRGMSHLARTITGAIARQTASPPVLELAWVQSDMSLKFDRFAVPIPAGEYLVTRWLTGYTGQQVDVSMMEQHNHEVTVHTPTLQPGDRVLVAWANDGRDPVVIDVVGVI